MAVKLNSGGDGVGNVAPGSTAAGCPSGETRQGTSQGRCLLVRLSSTDSRRQQQQRCTRLRSQILQAHTAVSGAGCGANFNASDTRFGVWRGSRFMMLSRLRARPSVVSPGSRWRGHGGDWVEFLPRLCRHGFARNFGALALWRRVISRLATSQQFGPPRTFRIH